MKDLYIDYDFHKNVCEKYATICASDGDEDCDLCHYTNTEVFDNLLKTATFWASNIRYMNDYDEYCLGLKKLNDVIKDDAFRSLQEDRFFERVFVISFSSQSDILHQWLTYAKESGVCLVFDRKLIDDYDMGVKSKNKKIISTPFLYSAKKMINKVKYIKKDELIEISSSIDKYVKEGLKDSDKELLFSQMAAFIKRYEFADESELRAVFCSVFANFYEDSIEIKHFHKSNGILRPYVEVAFLHKEKSGEYEYRLPLKEIVIGPSGLQQTIFDGVVHRCKYGDKKVHSYVGTKLCENFNAYLNNAISYWKENNKNVEINISFVKQQLYLNWFEEHRASMVIEPMKMQYDEKSSNFVWGDRDSVPQRPKLSVEERRAVDDIAHDNYFTVEGIWIKKSKIPYLYS